VHSILCMPQIESVHVRTQRAWMCMPPLDACMGTLLAAMLAHMSTARAPVDRKTVITPHTQSSTNDDPCMRVVGTTEGQSRHPFPVAAKLAGTWQVET
jgi:hypothetical protein